MRCVLVIINHYHKERGRTEIDEIADIFRTCGYKVEGLLNATTDDMIGNIFNCSREARSGNFICFISSHGSRTTLSSSSGNNGSVRVAAILEIANDKRHTRTNVFFIDACRTVKNEKIFNSDIPDIRYPDYFVGYSCLGSTVSKHGDGTCGLYFEALIAIFKTYFPKPSRERHTVRNIDYLMKKVHDRVASLAKQRGHDHQIPECQSTLTKDLFLQGDRY